MKNNHLKGLSYEPNPKPVKQVPFVQIVASVLLAAALLTLLKIWGGI